MTDPFCPTCQRATGVDASDGGCTCTPDPAQPPHEWELDPDSPWPGACIVCGRFTVHPATTDPAPAFAWAPDVEPDDGFWGARPILEHIRTFARARRASPWAVLGVVLARAVAATPPWVTLPPLVGGEASLNVYIGLVGPSGAGKGAAESAGRDCLDVGDITTIGIGSGEGLAHCFARRVKGALEYHTEAVVLSVPEIDTLGALGDRKGSTLLGELRKGWSGEGLGFSYADETKRLPIPAHHYRLSLVAGIQPQRAGALLGDRDAGTPQRFLWLPATDPHAPDVPPETPDQLLWQPPSWPRGDYRTGRAALPVCDTARTVIDEQRLARLRGEGDALDGHALLARLKVAAALALLDGHAEVTDDDWKLADEVMQVSDRTRAGVVDQLAADAAERNQRQGTAEGIRAAVAADVLEERTLKRVCTGILRRLDRGRGDWVARTVVRQSLAGRDRAYFDPSAEMLLGTGQIEVRGIDRDDTGHGGQGTAYRRVETP